jgi:hypothetical protein
VTERAQHAVRYAKHEAGRLAHDRVGTEHLLLGLLRDEQCLAVATLLELRFSQPDTMPGQAPPLIVSTVDLR